MLIDLFNIFFNYTIIQYLLTEYHNLISLDREKNKTYLIT